MTKYKMLENKNILKIPIKINLRIDFNDVFQKQFNWIFLFQISIQ